jgi:hypothetical protein
MSDDSQNKDMSFNEINEAEGAREAEREWPVGEAMAGDVTGRWWNEPLPTWRRPTDVLSTRV